VIASCDTAPTARTVGDGGPRSGSAKSGARRIAHAQVDLWYSELESWAEIGAASASSVELARAARFVFAHDARRFLAARGVLRRVLAEYLGCEPSRVALEVAAGGKPQVAGAALRFNMSHSRTLVVIAVTADTRGDVGVDVEPLHSLEEPLGLAAQIASTAEQQVLRRTAPALRSETILICWTRKEAALKLSGAGLSVDPRSVEVGCEDSQAWHSTSGAAPCRIRSFRLGGAMPHVGALAIEPGPDLDLPHVVLRSLRISE
jgi:4'-phosphopantetheinyl transferase